MRFRVAVDVGGTFTDLACSGDDGSVVALKVASTPREPERGVLDAVDALVARGVTPDAIERVAHASTVATNALLGQIGLELPRVVFVTTAGFRDVVEIGRQNRSRVYDLFVTRPPPLVAREDRVTVRERSDHRGEAALPLTDAEIARVADAVRARAPQSIAIGFLHAYANPEHERRVGAALARALPGIPISLSSEVDPAYREYERFSTTVVNAALQPIVRRYLETLRDGLRARGIDAPLWVMRSDGGLASVEAAAARPAMLIESGPAAGVVAAASLARATALRDALSFDMGGTTAKAGAIEGGRVRLAREFEAAGATHSGRAVGGSGYPVRFPFVDLAEISAGGGAIAWIDDGGGLRVGPLSAGADPGPACYGRSDRATVTDANVVLGRLPQDALLGGTFPIDASRSRAAIAKIADALALSVEATAEGIVALVDAQMAKVLRIVTVERGLDPRDFTLVAFGGNGALHACALAAELGIARIVVPPRPGLFSADGLLDADLRADASQSVLRESDALDERACATVFETLEARCAQALLAQGATAERIRIAREADARYRGQSFELTVEGGAPHEIARAFHAAHERRYGYAVEDEPVEIVAVRAAATASLGTHRFAAAAGGGAPEPRGERNVVIGGVTRPVPLYSRDALGETPVAGPALVEQYDAVTFAAPGWTLRRAGEHLEVRR